MLSYCILIWVVILNYSITTDVNFVFILTDDQDIVLNGFVLFCDSKK